jgi:hypothetical protein
VKQKNIMVDEAQNVDNTIKTNDLIFIYGVIFLLLFTFALLRCPFFGLGAKMSCIYLLWNPFGFDNMKISQPSTTLVGISKCQ